VGYLLHHSTGVSNGARGVFIATPTYGPPSAVFSFSLLRAQDALRAAGYRVEVSLLVGDCHVDDARNRLVREFLRSTCDDFVFIDSDVGFGAAELLTLLSYDRDVVGATYPLKQGQDDYPARLFPGVIQADADGLIEVDGLPTGFLRIRRHVLQAMFDEAPKYTIRGSDDRAPCALIFERQLMDGGRVSGDYAFCRKHRARGGKVYCAPEIYLEHAGEKVWGGSFGSFLRRQNGLSLRDSIEAIRKGTENARSLMQLVTEWGNDPYSAGPELLSACAQVARQLRGAVLECGSGLSTLIMGAANPDLHIHALEDTDLWRFRVTEAAESLGLGNITVHKAPLDDYAQGRWYSPLYLPWDLIDAVVCDGPSRQRGSREILLSALDAAECRPRVMLLDDAASQCAPFEQWAAANNYRFELKGELRQFAIMKRAA
jgi:hypothetical protein